MTWNWQRWDPNATQWVMMKGEPPGYKVAPTGNTLPPRPMPAPFAFRPPPPPIVTKRRRRVPWPARIGFAVIILIAGVVAGNAIRGSGKSTSEGGDIPGSTYTIAGLTASVKGQVTGPTSKGDFGLQGVDSVVCNPPSSWAPGKTFNCFVYGAASRQIAQYKGTILPDVADGHVQWNGQMYDVSASSTSSTAPSTDIITYGGPQGTVVWRSGQGVPSDSSDAGEGYYCCYPPFPDGMNRSGSAGCSGFDGNGYPQGGYYLNGQPC